MAANSVSIKLQGADSLTNKLKNLVPKYREGAKRAVAQTLLLIETDAKLLSPVDTGLNRAEIHTELAADGLSGQVIAGTSYAVHLEFGTKWMRARPFMHPAYEKNRPLFVALLKANYKLSNLF